MSAQKQKKRAKAGRDRRTNIINSVLVAVFVLAILAIFCRTQGWYLPAVRALTVDDSRMNAVTFNYFYRDCYDSFQSAYGDMLEAQGTIRSGVSLDEQQYSSGYSWAEFFYDTAVENAKRTLIVYREAEAAGYELSEEDIAGVDEQMAAIRQNAGNNGYSTGGGFLRGHYGPGSTMKSYRNYLLMQAVADGYSGDLYSSAEYTQEELQAWFEENYPDAGSDYDYNTVDFRMIYLPFSDYEYDADSGTYGYSEEDMDATLTQLRTISTLYVQGEQTEDSFAALAAEYSGYNKAEGGLYENAVKDDDDIETQVLNWIFASGRRPGDTDYIEADSGDYLLYWIGEDIPAWQYLAEEGLRDEAWDSWYAELSGSAVVSENAHILRYLYLTA